MAFEEIKLKSDETEKSFEDLYSQARKAGGEKKEKEIRDMVESLHDGTDKTIKYTAKHFNKIVKKRFKKIHPKIVFDMYIRNSVIGIFTTMTQNINDEEFDVMIGQVKDARKKAMEFMNSNKPEYVNLKDEK